MSANQPATFKDAQGDQWSVRLDFAGLHRIRDGADVDLGNVEQLAQTWASLLYDDLKSLDVIWLAVQQSATAKDIDRPAFNERMDGDSLEAALAALGEAVLSFTQPRKRGMAERAIRGVTEGMGQAIKQAELKIEETCKKSTQTALAALGMQPPSVPGSSATSTTGGLSGKRSQRSKQNAVTTGGG